MLGVRENVHRRAHPGDVHLSAGGRAGGRVLQMEHSRIVGVARYRVGKQLAAGVHRGAPLDVRAKRERLEPAASVAAVKTAVRSWRGASTRHLPAAAERTERLLKAQNVDAGAIV